MVSLSKLVASVAFTLFGVRVFAHPGEDPTALKEEAAVYKATLAHAHWELGQCQLSHAAVSLKSRAVTRRAQLLDSLREEYGVTDAPRVLKKDKDDLERYQAISHDVTAKGWNAGTPASTLFDTNSTTALTPEQILGPYFVSGELFRKEISEGQNGVRMLLELQFVNQNTCEAIPNMLVDIWHSNATGVYSCIAQAAGQGGLDTTWLRGFQRTSDEGVVQFSTIFPGHYGGRSNHIHILTSEDATLLPNRTYVGGKSNHVGQLYFDQELNDAVEKLDPYNTNRQQYTKNIDDGFASGAASDKYDPFVSYVRLGDKMSDGIMAFITVGIDQNAHYYVSPAVHWGESGGHECHDGKCD